VLDQHIDITTTEGRMNTFVTRPEGGGCHPVVLFLMDAPGKRPELHDMARRIARAGYYVMLPNLYYRSTPEFDASADLEGRVDEIRTLIATLDFDTIDRDAAALLRHAEADDHADPARVGVVGYCMSGPFAYAIAGLHPDRVAAAASIHGVRLHGLGSPQHLAHAVAGELYFACAELDEYVPREQIEQLDRHLRQHRVRARIEWYDGVRHGFVLPSRRTAYSEEHCEQHFDRILDLFRRNL
jgi:carboxymethylenebutenolidase